jgi:hypothetical protein
MVEFYINLRKEENTLRDSPVTDFLNKNGENVSSFCTIFHQTYSIQKPSKSYHKKLISLDLSIRFISMRIIKWIGGF